MDKKSLQQTFGVMGCPADACQSGRERGAREGIMKVSQQRCLPIWEREGAREGIMKVSQQMSANLGERGFTGRSGKVVVVGLCGKVVNL